MSNIVKRDAGIAACRSDAFASDGAAERAGRKTAEPCKVCGGGMSGYVNARTGRPFTRCCDECGSAAKLLAEIDAEEEVTSEEECLVLLRAIDTGRERVIKADAVNLPSRRGGYQFTTESGWVVSIQITDSVIDCVGWIMSPIRQVIEPWKMSATPGKYQRLREWRPMNFERWFPTTFAASAPEARRIEQASEKARQSLAEVLRSAPPARDSAGVGGQVTITGGTGGVDAGQPLATVGGNAGATEAPLVSVVYILDMLDAIDRGELELSEPDPRGTSVGYTTANGWGIVVFNDAGQWDCIEEVTSPEGRVIDLWRYLSVNTSDLNGMRGKAAEVERRWRTDPTYVEYEAARNWRPNDMRPWRWRF